MFQVLHNGTGGPVVIDAEGRQLGAGEWGVGNTTDPVAKAADERGDATFVPDSVLRGDISPEAQAAKDDAAARNSRAEALREHDKPVLAAAAEGLGLGEDPSKDELVAALASAGIDVEAPEPDAEPGGDAEAPATRRSSRAAAATPAEA